MCVTHAIIHKSSWFLSALAHVYNIFKNAIKTWSKSIHWFALAQTGFNQIATIFSLKCNLFFLYCNVKEQINYI